RYRAWSAALSDARRNEPLFRLLPGVQHSYLVTPFETEQVSLQNCLPRIHEKCGVLMPQPLWPEVTIISLGFPLDPLIVP
ncbi:MAG: hypothetical protein ACTSQV_08935, partial [Alphaproteobacteria bacterium]